MTQAGLDFSKVPNAFARRGSAQARHASRLGAESAANRAEFQTARYLALLQSHPEGLNDWEAAALMSSPDYKVERTTINARRSPLYKAGVVVPNGFNYREGSNVKNTRWQLAAMRKK